MPQDEWMTLTEVARFLRVSKITLRRWRKAGKLKDVYPDGRPLPGHGGNATIRIARSEVEKFMASGGVVQPPSL